MTKTRTQLVHRALRNLGVLAQGQTPSDEDYDSVNDLMDPLFAELASREIVTVPDPEHIDDDVFLALGHCLAGAARSEFGVLGTGESQEIAALAEKAERDLKVISSRGPTYKVSSIDYF